MPLPLTNYLTFPGAFAGGLITDAAGAWVDSGVTIDNLAAGSNNIDVGDTVDGEAITGMFAPKYTITFCDGTTSDVGSGAGGIILLYTGTTTYLFVNDDLFGDLVIESIQIDLPTSGAITSFSPEFTDEVDSVVWCCFTSGSLIKTDAGELAIEDLSVGDMVQTMDHGYQPIRWIGSNKVKAEGSLAPIVIRKDTLGNDRDLKVSPQHRMLLQGWQADLMFGSNEVLATAKSLINDSTIFRLEGGEVEYFHILFDTHEIVWANGCPSESFHPGEQGMNSLEEEMQSEIYALFPELEQNVGSYGPSARLSLKRKEATMLAQLMLNDENTAQKEMI